jgi:hypothetical protein
MAHIDVHPPLRSEIPASKALVGYGFIAALVIITQEMIDFALAPQALTA